MFTRTELEVKSLRALRDLCLIQYGIQAIGNPADKASYINALLTFPVVACKQVSENKGLKSPIFSQVESTRSSTRGYGNTYTRTVCITQSDDGRKKVRVPSAVQSREAIWTVSG
ncbi:hypothetical protein [Nostoc sp. CALU 1950]|uniref:hypothetical protein n=1 Tax=Nostoc sp. CALU 1950 TaxID=3104321 RepID=UPI003EC001D7